MSSVVEKIKTLFEQQGWSLSVAESCTGGALSAEIVSLAGVSSFYAGGVVSYSNQIKEKILKVSSESLAEYSAVSLPVVLQMAQGVQSLYSTDWSISTSGVAGPDSGSEREPVGTLCLAVIGPNVEWKKTHLIQVNSRSAFIKQSVFLALDSLWSLAQEKPLAN